MKTANNRQQMQKIEEKLENFLFPFPLNFDYLLNVSNNNAFIWLML